MKILHINTIDTGGAAIAATRLHYLLLENGVESKILFLKRSGDKQIKEAYYFEDIFRSKFLFYLLEKLNTFYNRRFTFHKPKIYFNGPDSLFNISRHPLFAWADVIHFHWVVKFLDWQKVFSHKSKAFVWTMHDMNPITGGEHYQTGYHHEFKRTEGKNIYKKKHAVNGARLTVIGPSKWLTGLVTTSEIFKNTPVKTIKNPLDTDLFRTKNKIETRNKYNLPANKKIILFVAENPEDIRKGYKVLIRSIEKIEEKENYHLAIIGKETIAPILNTTFFGTITDENILADIYNSADLFVIPSLEDNLPNTVSEALLCGTPVAGFKIGGIPDLIIDGINGYLSDNFEDLDKTIVKTIHHNFDQESVRNSVLDPLNPSSLVNEFMAVYKESLIR